MDVYRQGDVILRKVDYVPTNVHESGLRTKAIRISGETGHEHVLEGDVFGNGSFGSYVVLEQPTELKHDEHDNIEIPPGIYRVDSVRDYRSTLERTNRFYGD